MARTPNFMNYIIRKAIFSCNVGGWIDFWPFQVDWGSLNWSKWQKYAKKVENLYFRRHHQFSAFSTSTTPRENNDISRLPIPSAFRKMLSRAISFRWGSKLSTAFCVQLYRDRLFHKNQTKNEVTKNWPYKKFLGANEHLERGYP